MHAASIPGFEILELIQESSKTLTWRARQHSLDRIVTLKVLQAEAAVHPAELARFLLVARTLSRLKADGLAQIYDVVSEGERHYIVMEAVDGPTLSDLVLQKGHLPVAQVMRIAFTVAEALAQAWDVGRLVHRNLKPTAIRLDSRGVAKITDFGQAVLALPDHDVTELDEGHIVGTPHFLSPEQSAGERHLDCRADMYALGTVLYYLLTGHMPFGELPAEAAIQMQISGQLPHPRAFRADLPATACGLVERLTMKRPEDRYATWTDAMGDMQHVLKNLPLRRRESAPKGAATLAPETPPAPRSATTPAMSVTGRPASTPGAAAAAGAAARPRPHARGPSPFTRMLLWLLLTVWFAVLANDRLGDPLRLGYELASVPGDVRALFARLSAQVRPATPVAATPTAAPRQPTTPVPPPATPPSTPSVTPPEPPPPAPSAEPPVPRAAPAEPVTLAPELTGRLSVELRQGNLEAARAMLRAAPASPAVLAARAVLDEAPDMNRLVEDGIMRMRGQEIEIEFMGKKRQVVPQRVVNGEIFVDITADKRTVSFETRRLSPAERLRWAGNLDTPAKQTAACAMMLQSGDVAYTAEKAGACGILAPAFEMAANR